MSHEQELVAIQMGLCPGARLPSVTQIFLAKCSAGFKYILAGGKFPWNEVKKGRKEGEKILGGVVWASLDRGGVCLLMPEEFSTRP